MKKSTQENIEARIKWKKTLNKVMSRGIMSRETHRIKIYEVGHTVNDILEDLHVRYRIPENMMYFYSSIPENSKNLFRFRVPENKLIANVLVCALESLEAWIGVDESEKEKEKKELIELLGFDYMELPKPTSRVYGTEFKNLSDAKKYASEILYAASISNLNNIYKNQDPKIKEEIIGELEKIIEKYHVD